MNPIEHLDKKFGEIPHSVQLFDLYKVTNETCASILKRIESELKGPEEDEDEMVRRTNLSTSLLFHLKQTTEAQARNEKILEKYPKNITALVNSICIKMAVGCEWEAEALLEKLKSEWKKDGFLRASAFADEAYSLSRIRPRFFIRSIELFLKAIEKFPGNHSWKFGCALTCKRCLSLARGVTNISSDDLKRFCEMAVSFLYEVACHGNGRLVALSWAHLGELLNILNNAAIPLSAQIVSVAKTLCPLSAEDCLIKALKCHGSQKDESVLERCGHSLQYARSSTEYECTLNSCYALLVKANILRPTPYSCDKLASILLKMVEKGITPPSISIIDCLDVIKCLNLANSQTTPTGQPRSGYHFSRKENKQTIRAAIPSARVVQKYLRHPLLIQAAEYLKTSVQLTEGTNMYANQNLGMIYRRLDNLDLAIEAFRRILSFQEVSLYEKVNAYEQIGFCHLDKSENPNLSKAECQQEKEKGTFMMKRAVEEAARLVASLHFTGGEQLDSLESYPTLKQLLSNEPIPEHIKDIAKLCQLIGNHKEALDWYMKLQEFEPDDVETFYNVVVTRMRLKHFTTAQNYFNVLMGSSEGRQLLHEKPELFDQVYLGTIKHLMRSISEEDMNDLKMSCRAIFDYKHRKTSSSGKNEECDAPYDIFILDNPDMTTTEADELQVWLTDKCGLSVTRNDNDVNFGSYSLLHEAGFITNSKIVIVILDTGELDTRMSNLLSIAITEKRSNFIISVGSDQFELPLLLRGSPSVKRPPKEEGDAGHQRFLLQCFMSTLGLNIDTFPWIE